MVWWSVTKSSGLTQRVFVPTSCHLEVTTPVGRYLKWRSEGDAPTEYGHHGCNIHEKLTSPSP